MKYDLGIVAFGHVNFKLAAAETDADWRECQHVTTNEEAARCEEIFFHSTAPFALKKRILSLHKSFN